MLHSLTRGRSLIAAAAIVWGVAFGTSADANTITITPQAGASNPDPVTVTSTAGGAQDFVGLVAGFGNQFLAGTFSFTDATGFVLPPGNEATEAAQLTTVCACGTTFAATGKQDPGGTSITVTDPFFAIKQDGWIAFFHNLIGTLTVTTDTAVSHATFFVPFPALGAGLPGLVLACGGLLALARRRRQQFA